MKKKVLEEYAHVHDNIVLSYHVDICNEELKLITRYFEEELVTITFKGVSTHQFDHVTYQNMLMGIWRVPTDLFIEENKELLEEYLNYGAPIVAQSCDELKKHLNETGQQVFEIGASIGLCGFVFAKEILIEVEPYPAKLKSPQA